MARRSCAALTLALLAMPSLAWAPPWPVTYTLDTIPVSACGVTWEDYGSGWLERALISFQSTEAGDCLVGLCSFAPVAGGVDS
ncbi:hypothetical protein FJ251_10095, partial [bacterium]|nr:hypothetical protein [bacterium]